MKIFISHSSKDKRFVRTLKTDLNENGIETFFDEDSLELGDSLKEKLELALDESSHFVIVLTPNSLSSNWVKFELNEAIKLFDTNTLKKIIPIKYRDCELPDELSNLLYADLSSEIVVTENDKVRFISEGYSYFLIKLINTIKASDKRLNKTDKKELQKEVSSTDTKIQKQLENFVKIKHKVLRFKDKSTVDVYRNRIAKYKNIKANTAIRPVILPPVYKVLFKGISIGDKLYFTQDDAKVVDGDFAGFRPEDIGIALHPVIRNFLEIDSGEMHTFSVNINKRTFIIED